MKLDRLISILTILQQEKKITAPQLARRLEVSRRTISRDIDALCRAGIPIVTTQGAGGGLSLMEGFTLDGTLFTRQELAAILTGLTGLDSVAQSPGAALRQKLGNGALFGENELSIDLASFYKHDLAPKIDLLRRGIREHRLVTFRYAGPGGESAREIEPCLVAYRWSDWYLFGFCRARQDFRLFKLRRLWELALTDTVFTPREIPEERRQFGANMTDDYLTVAVYQPGEKYRLVEEYGPRSFETLPDGRLLAKWGFSHPEDAVWWFLSFGDRVQVLGPPELVQRMRSVTEKMAELYRET